MERRREALETYALCVGRRVAVDLVSAQDDEIRLLLVEQTPDKLQRPGVGVAFPAIVPRGLWIATLPDARAQMQIRHLHDLELALLTNPRHWLLDPRVGAPSDRQSRLLALGRRHQQQRWVLDLPAGPRLDRVRSKEDVDGGDGPLRVARAPPERPLQPYPRGPGLPPLVALAILARDGVEPTDADVDDYLVLWQQLFVFLALHVHVRAGYPGFVQVEILLDAMPAAGRGLAAGEEGEGGASRNADVGDDEAGVVGGEVVVDRGREDSVAVVEEEDEDERHDGQGGEL